MGNGLRLVQVLAREVRKRELVELADDALADELEAVSPALAYAVRELKASALDVLRIADEIEGREPGGSPS